MALTSQWKIALNRSGEAYLLINTEQDHQEQQNLAADPDYLGVKDELRLQILERLVSTQRYVTGSKALLGQWRQAHSSSS
jgi:hypothetical protein